MHIHTADAPRPSPVKRQRPETPPLPKSFWKKPKVIHYIEIESSSESEREEPQHSKNAEPKLKPRHALPSQAKGTQNARDKRTPSPVASASTSRQPFRQRPVPLPHKPPREATKVAELTCHRASSSCVTRTPYSYMAPPPNTTLHASASIPESRQLKEFLRLQVKCLRIPEEELRKIFTENYGSLQKAMELIQAADAHDAATVARAFPPGERPKEIGRKPIPGEDHDVQIAQLSDGVWVRIWGGDLADQGCYCFDFVNSAGQHMRTPRNIKVFSATAGMPNVQVFSIEASLDKAAQRSPQFAWTLQNSIDESGLKPDPEWETYVLQQGVRLCFKQAGKEDVFADIPRRNTRGRTLTFQPWPY
ncbi:hypothetical protein FPV67DRAFT_512339 [Lyophyllum atratum]|nr:hypothetical protein FPV67DRAFT_512339 [Lyophyllum atratum]